MRGMKFLFRWAFRLLILAIVLVIGLVLLADTLFREAAIKKIKAETGLEARIEKMRVSFFSPTVTIDNLILYNPAEFGGSPVVEIPDLHLEYDSKAFRSGEVHLRLLRLGVREIHVVENDQGQINVLGLVSGLKKMPSTRSPGSRGNGLKFDRVDFLNLSVGTVRYTNMRFPKRNSTTELGIRNEMIPNIRTPEDAAGVLLKVLVRAGITLYGDGPARSRLL